MEKDGFEDCKLLEAFVHSLVVATNMHLDFEFFCGIKAHSFIDETRLAAIAMFSLVICQEKS